MAELVVQSRTLDRRPTPCDRERPFGFDESFFSTTDRRGIITSGNRVFARVSGYERADLIGKPHNIVRHPDMPRAVFQLLWEELEAGRPIAAYVKNLARDGAYYWVMATIVACEGGYLSVRIKPSSPFFPIVQAVYADLLALEQQVEDGQPRRRAEAMAAARARLGEHLAGAGFATYEQFMRAALLAEVVERERRRGAAATRPAAPPSPDADPMLPEILADCDMLGGFLGMLVSRLDEYTGLGRELDAHVGFLQELTEDVRLFSLNALLAATRVSGDSASLTAVAGLMQAESDQCDPAFRALTDDVASCSSLLDSLLFPVAVARLQVESAAGFLSELLEARQDEQGTVGDLVALGRCLADGVERVASTLTELDRRVRQMGEDVLLLTSSLKTLRALEINGRIEAARTAQASDVVSLFSSIAEQIGAARTQLETLSNIGGFALANEALAARRTGRTIARVRERIDTVARHGGAARALAAATR